MAVAGACRASGASDAAATGERRQPASARQPEADDQSAPSTARDSGCGDAKRGAGGAVGVSGAKRRPSVVVSQLAKRRRQRLAAKQQGPADGASGVGAPTSAYLRAKAEAEAGAVGDGDDGAACKWLQR